MTGYEQLAQAPLGDNILAQISQTARDILEAQEEVRQREEDLKDAQKRLRVLQEDTLPELMQEAGQEELTTADGLKVSIKEIIRGTPSKDNAAAAYEWLRQHGHGGIIKSTVKADLGKADSDQVQKAVSALTQLGAPAKADQTVAWQTLGALVREMMSKGQDVPLDLLGVLIWKQAEVKPKG